MEPEQLACDLKRISELFDQEQLQLITISGGEPLLHERVSEFPYIVRKYFPKVHTCAWLQMGCCFCVSPRRFGAPAGIPGW
ncbi:hypothetical protein [Luoshenia tenuis]|jgi:hypothetical protein|uniref:hypothetical protein n=1 Tax=Luoshenia tenuis TaxID=2763654 RepID=UPI003D90B5E0